MSLSRSEQARINGAKSRGPKTAHGKTISSMNALKHGRFSKDTTRLFFESPEQSDQLLDALLAQFRPATVNERLLVDRLAGIQHNYDRAQLAYTTYVERLFRYASPERLEIPPTANPMDTLVAAEEESLTRTPYLKFITRRMSQLLVDYNRVLHALRICKRDFPATAPVPDPVPAPNPDVAVLVETPENFQCVGNIDFFPKRPVKSTTSTPPCPFQTVETNPSFEPRLPPQSPFEDPASPPIPLPKAA